MRFLHSADLHLDSPLRAQALKNPDLADDLRGASRRVLEAIVDIAIGEDVDALLLAGDIFDSGVADVTSRAALVAGLGQLARAGIPTVLIRGNHDALLDHTRYGPLGDGIHLLDRKQPTVRIGDAAIHGLSFSARHETESMLPAYPAPEPGRINIGLLHSSLGGAPGHDLYAPCSEAELFGFGYDYWALGHIHKRFERRGEGALAVMPGIPQGRSIRETGRGSVTLVEIGPDGIRASERPVGLIAFDLLAVDLAGVASQAQALETLRADLSAAARADCAVALRLEIAHAPLVLRDPGVLRSLAEEAAAGIGGVYVEAVRFVHGEAALPTGVIADLARIMRDDAASPGFQDEAAQALAQWQAALPREIADVLAPEHLESLIAEGLDLVTAHLSREVREE